MRCLADAFLLPDTQTLHDCVHGAMQAGRDSERFEPLHSPRGVQRG